jgi:hypothetical protein
MWRLPLESIAGQSLSVRAQKHSWKSNKCQGNKAEHAVRMMFLAAKRQAGLGWRHISCYTGKNRY